MSVVIDFLEIFPRKVALSVAKLISVERMTGKNNTFRRT